MKNLIDIDRKNIWHPFTSLGEQPDLPVITEAKGIYLHTDDGRKILDGVSSWWVNLHGHANPIIASAIAEQAAKLEHVIFAGFTHEPAIRLSENLLRILPGHQKIFFSDNGSTAVEVGLKMALQYWHNQGIEREKVIAINGAYHGDTFGAMSVAERGLFTKPFHKHLFETIFIDFPTKENEDEVINRFSRLIDEENIAAFIFEPLVQAASGMRMYSPRALDTLISLARQSGVICIADEVFTGFGRTGKYFAVDHLVSKPDILTMSKGVTGGFLPLGVTSCSEKIVSAFDSPAMTKTFFHGHSYTGNPLACAAANASFSLLTQDSCQERIKAIGNRHMNFVESISGNKHIAEVRALGTILAIELQSAEGSAYENSMRGSIYRYFLKRDILLRPLGNIIYFLPPYVISDAELERVYAAIRDFLNQM